MLHNYYGLLVLTISPDTALNANSCSVSGGLDTIIALSMLTLVLFRHVLLSSSLRVIVVSWPLCIEQSF